MPYLLEMDYTGEWMQFVFEAEFHLFKIRISQIQYLWLRFLYVDMTRSIIVICRSGLHLIYIYCSTVFEEFDYSYIIN